MVPTSWLGLLLFLLVVAPGLLFELLGARRRVAATESAFREIGRVVLGSLVFTAIAVFVLSLLRIAFPELLPDPRGLITGGSAYLVDHYYGVLAAVFAEIVLAHAAAYGLHAYLARRHGATIRPVSAWTKVFKHDLPDGRAAVVHVRVRLGGGIVVSGTVAHYSPDLALADRELVLGPPLYSKTGDNPPSQLPPTYRRLLIRGSQIETMAVEYRAPNG